MYDRVAMGTTDDVDESHEEFATSLEELDAKWHVGPENNASWKEALKNKTPSLFSVNFDSSKVSAE